MHLLDSSYAFLNELEFWDKWLFVKINSQFTNQVFDWIMPYLRNSFYWAPLYLFLLVFIIMNYGAKGLWWCLFFLCLVAMTDIVSSRIFKEGFDRLRPCNDPEFLSHVRLLVQCPSGPSFTSSHAANHFGMAVYISLTLRKALGKWIWITFLWARIISYAQIYVGVHYPSDILGGAALGVFFGLLISLFFNKKFGFITFDEQPTV